MSPRLPTSRLCFGCEPLGGVDWGQVNILEIGRAIGQAIEFGIDFFDTADVYGLGLSEQRLGAFLGPRRHDMFIATKGGLTWHPDSGGGRARISRDSSPGHLRVAVEASLQRLQIERIPLYYIHWPDPLTDLRVTFECLMQLREQGKIEHIGCSNFNADQVRAASEVATISFAQMQVNLLGDGPDEEMTAALDDHGISVVAYNVLASGLLTGKYDEVSRFSADDRRSRLEGFRGDKLRLGLETVDRLRPEAAAAGLSVAQYSIRKALERPGVAAVTLGIKNRQQLEENWAAVAGNELAG